MEICQLVLDTNLVVSLIDIRDVLWYNEITLNTKDVIRMGR